MLAGFMSKFFKPSLLYVTWMRRSTTCSLTSGCFCHYELRLDMKAGLLCVQADIPERPNEVWQNRRAKGGSAFSQSCMHTHPHTNGMFSTSLGYLCVHSVSWKREVDVSMKCGMQTRILDDEAPPFRDWKWWLETCYCIWLSYIVTEQMLEDILYIFSCHLYLRLYNVTNCAEDQNVLLLGNRGMSTVNVFRRPSLSPRFDPYISSQRFIT